MTLSLKISPLVPEDRLYPVVDAVIALIRASGVKHLVGPSETTLEGDWDTLLPLVRRAHELCVELGAPRVGSVIMIDFKPAGVTMEEKVGKYRLP